MTIEFDYSRKSGITKAKALLKGQLSATVDFRVRRGNTRAFAIEASPIIIPIPASLGTLRVKMPFGIYVELDSSLELSFAKFEGKWQYSAGAQLNTVSGSLEDLSSFSTIKHDVTIPSENIILNALSVLGINPAIRANLVDVTIGPYLAPQLEALNGSLGVLSIQNKMGLNASLEALASSSSRPCIEMPLKIRLETFAIFNYLRYSSLWDFIGDPVSHQFRVLNSEVLLDRKVLTGCESEFELNIESASRHLGDDPGNEGTFFEKRFSIPYQLRNALLTLNLRGPNDRSPPQIRLNGNLLPYVVPTGEQLNPDGSRDYNETISLRFDVTRILLQGENQFSVTSGRPEDDYFFDSVRILGQR